MQNQSEEDREAQMEAAEDEHKALMLEVGALRAEVQAMRAETAAAIDQAVGRTGAHGPDRRRTII